MGNNRRSNILINRAFQFRLILKFLAVNLFIVTLFAFFMYLFTNSELHASLNSAHVTYQNVHDIIMPIVIALSLLNLVVSSIIITFFVLLASHKIAGPLYRFNTALASLRDRNLHPFTSIRDGDQLVECADTLGEVVAILGSDIGDLKAMVLEVKGELGRDDRAGAFSRLKQMEDILEKYRL